MEQAYEIRIGQADEFEIIYTTGDGMVTIFDGEGSVRLTVPYDIWKALTNPIYQEIKL